MFSSPETSFFHRPIRKLSSSSSNAFKRVTIGRHFDLMRRIPMKPHRSLILLVLIMGCARSVTRMNPAESVDLSGRWNDTDSRQVADAMVADLLGSEKFKDYAKALGKKPTIIVGLVRNKTSEH